MYWRRWLSVVLLLSVVMSADALPPQWAFRVSFTDKLGSADINNPISFLSQRALDRRNRQHIVVDTTDLPVSPRYIDSVLTITGGIFHGTSRWMNNCVVLLDDSSKILQLQGRPYIKSIALVAFFDTGLHLRPAQNKFSKEEQLVPGPLQFRTTGSAGYYGQAYDQTAMVNGDYLHDLGLKGEGVLIAVLDAGFVFGDTHLGLDSLRTSGRLVDKYDFLLRDTNTVFSFSAHGFRALSTMAGNLPGTYVGAAPHAMYALYRTEEEAGNDRLIEMDNFVAGAERADSLGADVISSSLGYVDFQNPFFIYSQAELDGQTTFVSKAAMLATRKGILFVSSAGNEGANGLVSPGDCDGVLTVGMVNFSENPDPGSGYGPNALGHVKPNVATAGAPAYVFSDGGSGIGVAVGTSFATPQIAGWAACLLQGAKPGTTPYQVRDAINRSADHYSNPGVQIGYGIPDFKVASFLLGVSDTTKTPATDDFIAVWPNAFTTDLRVEINAAENETIEFCMIDMGGRIVWRAGRAFVKGKQWWHMAVPGGLPGGLYLFKAAGKNQQQVVKLVKI